MLGAKGGSSSAPTNEALVQLADMARVPTEHRDFYFDEVRRHFQTLHDLDELSSTVLAGKRGESLQRTAIDLYRKLSDLTEGEIQVITGILNGEGKHIFRQLSGDGLSSLLETTRQIALLLSLVTGKTGPHASLQSRKRGRKTGQTKNPKYQNFVWGLLTSTKTAGGKLTVEKTGQFGTLIEALKMMEGHLPNEFVLNPLSATTLQRIATKCDRVLRALNAIDKE